MNKATQKFWRLYDLKMQSNYEFFDYLFNNSMVQLGNYQNFLEWYPNIVKWLNNGEKVGKILHSTSLIGKKIISNFKASYDFNDDNLYWFLYDKLTGVIAIHHLEVNDLPLVNKLMDNCLANKNPNDTKTLNVYHKLSVSKDLPKYVLCDLVK